MIERSSSGTFDASCDCCPGGSAQVTASHFADAVDELKKLGWRISKKNGEWHHECTDCVGGDADEEFSE